MDHLPTDTIIFGILTKATIETVGRCRCVCKAWNGSLSTPEFEKLHLCRPVLPSEQRILIIDHVIGSVYAPTFDNSEYCRGAIIACPFTRNITNISVLSHLDGLLCVWVHDTHALYLWNPTTTQYKNLAALDDLGIYIDSKDTIGLYKHSTYDYRVIHIRRTSHTFDTNIYSRETASWRNIHLNPNIEYGKLSYYWSPGTQCGERVYFSVYNSVDGQQKTIVTFDIHTEEFAEITFPPVASRGVFVANLITIHEKLHMFVTTGVREMVLQVWALKEEQWTPAFSNSYIPHIPVPVWGASTHYMTNGLCFLMRYSLKVVEVGAHKDPVNCFHCIATTQDNVATLFLRTLVAPSL